MRAKLRYDLSCYDRNLFLRPPLLLWIAMLYTSRAIVLSLIAQISGADTVAALRGAFTADALIPSSLGSLVMIAVLTRSQWHGGLVRWFVMHGNWALACVALLDLALAVSEPWRAGAPISISSLLVAVCDLAVMAYVLGSRRVRDVFRSYPVPVSEELGSK